MKEWTEIVDGKEVKKVQSNWLYVEKEILEWKIEQLAGERGLFKAVDLGDWFHHEPIKMGINWSCIGETDTETARRFAQNLMEACKLADEFKYNGYFEDFSISFDDLSPEEKAEMKQYLDDNTK